MHHSQIENYTYQTYRSTRCRFWEAIPHYLSRPITRQTLFKNNKKIRHGIHSVTTSDELDVLRKRKKNPKVCDFLTYALQFNFMFFVWIKGSR